MNDQVVITGISGTFPNATNVSNLCDNLLNKVDMVTADNRRWKSISPLPERSGKILDAEKFDLGYFGVTSLQSDHMDPMVRKVLEKAIETIIDAGYHPSDLEGTNTAVVGGYMCGDTEKYVFYENQTPSSGSITGNQRSILSKRISYHLKLNGQVYVTDTACSSSMYAFEHAYTMIKDGLCDKVLICGTNLCLDPTITLQYVRLEVLSSDGICRTFDDTANGYVRSDGIVTILLERRKDAKRVYAEVIHVKTSCDGYKNEGITHPLSDTQQVLLREFYDGCNVDPNSLTFVEAHGTGTQVGDPEELKAIDSIFCKGRDKPLHIGSVKSSIGHTEAASALCSIIKVVMSMETGYILPNIHYKTPRKGVEALEQERMVVATEKFPLPDNRGLFAIDSFGIGGANAHTLLFWNTKLKINDGQPNDDLPRLLCVSSRTAEGVNVILDDLKKYDAEYAYLIHQVFRKPFENHLYRGFGIYSEEGELKRSLVKVGMKEKKLYLVFGNFHKEFLKLENEFIKLPTFAKSIESIHNVLLKSAGINFLEIMKNPMKENFVNQILISAAIQISLANILKEINLIAHSIVGVGSGEVIAAYADDYLTLEQTIQTLFYIASDLSNSKNKNEQILENITRWRKNVNAKWTPTHQQEPGKSLAKYFTNNIASGTNEWNLKNLLTKDAVPLIIGTGFENMSEIKNVYLVDPNSKFFIQDFLSTLGSLYEYGFDMQLDKLYPSIELPVSRGTPMLSPLIKWNHLRDCTVHHFDDEEQTINGYRTVYIFPRVAEWNFIIGHLIDGRHLFPATGFLYLVWETFAKMTGKVISETKIVFEDVRFIRAANLSTQDTLILKIIVRISSRTFEIVEGQDTVVTGKVFEKTDEHTFSNLQTQAFEDEELLLNQADVYKELHLRGYNYRGLFKGIRRSSVDGSKVIIKWNGNWIAFMDCFLQVVLLQQDNRNMYLPTYISQLIIDASKFLNNVTNQSMVHVEFHKAVDVLKAEGIELKSLKATFGQRKKTENPVLETYKFIANEGECNAEDSVRVLMQFVLENSDTLELKVVEVCPEEMKEDQLLCSLIQKVLKDIPLVAGELLVLSNKPMELSHIEVRNQPLKSIISCSILIIPNLLEGTELLLALSVIKAMKGFIISREALNTDLSKFNHTTLDVLCSYKTNEEILVLLRPIQRSSKEALTTDITNSIEDFKWIPKLQDLLSKNDRIIIYAQGDETNGILGLTNCLKKERYGDKLSAVFIMDDASKFDPNLDFYKKQLDKNLLINVWKDGTWGTYRQLQLSQTQTVQKEHCYVSVTRRGNLSSMTWFEGSLGVDDPVVPEKELIRIYYSAVNFYDLMTASGKLPPDLTESRIEQECVPGMEFSGRDTEGRRVMGICQRGSLATLVQCDKYFIYPIPDDWTMEDAATVPLVYATVIPAFNRSSQPRPGQTILIHSGAGGVGQAAINLCLHFGLTVFVTVGTQEKRNFIEEHYPQIKEEHIGNSRDTSFEWMIKRYTNGKGVDYILNSLTEEKLLASVRCLAKGGKFIEIGKMDLISNNELALHLLEKEGYFISLDIHRFNPAANNSEKKAFYDQLINLIKRGVIKPLPRTVFSNYEVKKAFRHMGQGKHIGKILIKIRDEEEQKQYLSDSSLFRALPKFYCKPTCSYVIPGGLGGFGFELADFLIVRGARKLVLVSRSGITNGYQQYTIRIWKSYGVDVLITTCNISTEGGCTELLNLANDLGTVDGIFNLAMVLKDTVFDNQSIDDFKKVFSPKVSSTKHLDKISRKLCPRLRYFVVFSSLASGRGNVGQTNYGMVSSIMERICEKRKKEGYPALAIQWGAIGDVGQLVKTEEDISNDVAVIGTRQQRISSCLDALDKFLIQEETVVSSMLVAETKTVKKVNNPVEAVLNVIGITNINTVSMYSTLPELGMDSIMAIEIKQTLEREYGIFLTGQDMTAMTLNKLEDLSDTREIQTTVKADKETDIPLNIRLLFPNIGNGENANVPVLKMKTSVEDDENAPHIFALPGLDGTSTSLEPLCRKLKAHVFCLQFSLGNKRKSISEIAESFLPHVVSFNGDLIILAYSFGCVIATELLYLLAMKGRRANVIYLDGSADLIRDFTMQYLPFDDESLFQMKFLMLSMASYMTHDHIMTHKNNILQYKYFEEKLDYVISLLEEGKLSQHFKEACVSIYNRIVALCEYKPKVDKLKFPITLFKPTTTILKGISPDYNLSSFFENHIDICNVEGTHVTMLENDDLAVEINEICRRD